MPSSNQGSMRTIMVRYAPVPHQVWPSAGEDLSWYRRTKVVNDLPVVEDAPARRLPWLPRYAYDQTPIWIRRSREDAIPQEELPGRPRYFDGLNNYFHVVTNEWQRRKQPDDVSPVEDLPARRFNPGWISVAAPVVDQLPWFKRPKIEDLLVPEDPARPRWFAGLNNYVHVVTIEWLRRKQDEPPAIPEEPVKRAIFPLPRYAYDQTPLWIRRKAIEEVIAPEDPRPSPRWSPGMLAAIAVVVDQLGWRRRSQESGVRGQEDEQARRVYGWLGPQAAHQASGMLHQFTLIGRKEAFTITGRQEQLTITGQP